MLTLRQLRALGQDIASRIIPEMVSPETLTGWENDKNLRYISVDDLPLVERVIGQGLTNLGKGNMRASVKLELLHVTGMGRVHSHKLSDSVFFGRDFPEGARMFRVLPDRTGRWAYIPRGGLTAFVQEVSRGTAHAFATGVRAEDFYIFALSSPPWKEGDTKLVSPKIV